mmetsp:Transcript_37478/g.75944  ORF Transcript_37478/g.75944 Transcript_37478/m.75944 type:complete len:88 (-) Transcript_37478:381-644(-)
MISVEKFYPVKKRRRRRRRRKNQTSGDAMYIDTRPEDNIRTLQKVKSKQIRYDVLNNLKKKNLGFKLGCCCSRPSVNKIGVPGGSKC